MESRGRLIENEENMAFPDSSRLDKVGGEFYALRFTPGKCGRGLPESQVAQSNIVQYLEPVNRPSTGRVAFEEPDCLGDRHVQDFVDVLTAVLDVEHGEVRRSRPRSGPRSGAFGALRDTSWMPSVQ